MGGAERWGGEGTTPSVPWGVTWGGPEQPLARAIAKVLQGLEQGAENSPALE